MPRVLPVSCPRPHSQTEGRQAATRRGWSGCRMRRGGKVLATAWSQGAEAEVEVEDEEEATKEEVEEAEKVVVAPGLVSVWSPVGRL